VSPYRAAVSYLELEILYYIVETQRRRFIAVQTALYITKVYFTAIIIIRILNNNNNIIIGSTYDVIILLKAALAICYKCILRIRRLRVPTLY